MDRRGFLGSSALAAFGGMVGLGSGSGVGPISVALAQGTGVKPPTEHTKAANRRVLDALPFNDRRDFDDARRGFIAGLPEGVIRTADGRVVFTAANFQVPMDAPAPDTMNPSLWRVAQLTASPASSGSSIGCTRSAASTSPT